MNERINVMNVSIQYLAEGKPSSNRGHLKRDTRVINGYLVLAILRLRVRFRLLVCREHFDPFWDAMASFIGCYEVAQETGLKFLSQKSPIVQLDAAPTQFHVQPQTGHSVVKSDTSHIFT